MGAMFFSSFRCHVVVELPRRTYMDNLEKIHLLVCMHQHYEGKTSARKAYIYRLGACLGVEKECVDRAFAAPPSLPTLGLLSETEQFEIIYYVVQFMRLEKRICNQEMVFCERLAATMGYRAQLIAEISSYVYSDPSICAQREVLRRITTAHRVYAAP